MRLPLDDYGYFPRTPNSVQAKMKILVPASLVNQRLNSYFANLAKRVRIPGFRPGKAPTAVVKQKFATEAATDVSERLISEFVLNAVREKQLQLILPPTLIATDLPAEGQDFKFEVAVDLKPKVPELQLSSITIEASEKKEVADEAVIAQIDQKRNEEASFKEISETRPVLKDDCVVMSFDGNVDGVKMPGMFSESYTLVMGQGQFLPDFETALIGMKVAEEKTFPVSFPENYQAKDLQGKTAQFTVKLSQIKEKILPELDDDFAKSIDPDVQSLAELKQKVRERLESEAEENSKEELKKLLGEKLVEKHPFEVSQRQIEMLAERLAERAHHMMHEIGVQHEETQEHYQSIVQSSMKRAEHDVKLSYILEAIAKSQKIEVGSEDIQKRLEQTSKRTKLSIPQLEAYYAEKDEDETSSRIDRLKIDILDEKSLDYAFSQATMKNKGSLSA